MEAHMPQPTARLLRWASVHEVTPELGVSARRKDQEGLRFGRDEDAPAALWASFVVEASHCARISSGSAVVRLRRLAGAAAGYRGARTPPPASERGRRERSHRPSGLARGFSAGPVFGNDP